MENVLFVIYLVVRSETGGEVFLEKCQYLLHLSFFIYLNSLILLIQFVSA